MLKPPLMQLADDIAKYLTEMLPENTAFILLLADKSTISGSSNLVKQESTVFLLEAAIEQLKEKPNAPRI